MTEPTDDKPATDVALTSDAPWGDWGKLGPAMRKLGSDRQRKFVYYYVHLNTGKHSAPMTAYELAGYKPNERNLRTDPYKLLQREEIVEAVIEESKRALRAGAPNAVAALHRLVNDPTHRDHARGIAMLLDRVDPVLTRHDMRVEHEHRVTLSADDEA